MNLFEDTTNWVKLDLNMNSDEDFIEQFNKVFNFYESEYNPEASMSFCLSFSNDVWIDIERPGGLDEDFTLKIKNEEIEFEEYTAESILKAIKQNIV